MERFNLHLQANIYVCDEDQGQETINLMCSNICAGGAFFQTNTPLLPVGKEVKIDMVLPLNKQKNPVARNAFIEASGTTIRSDEKGMAIEFNDDYKISPLTEAKVSKKEQHS